MFEIWVVGQYEYTVLTWGSLEITVRHPDHNQMLKEGWGQAWVDHSTGGSFFVYRRLI